jgi:S-adenosylmethionine-diacylglycerol 3-amino-3-carboxypropyl transferase
MESQVHRRPVFERLLFAQSWEDPELDIAALGITARDRVLVTTSGGCNALSILTTGPATLIAIDMNPAQNWLLELKLAGLRALRHEEYLGLLGVRFIEEPSPHPAPPTELYSRIRPLLSPDARRFWDARGAVIQRGVLHAGRYESYLRLFRPLLRLAVGPRAVRDLMRQTMDTQAEFYRTRWDRPVWRVLLRAFFSRRVLGQRGLDPDFFRYVEGVPSFGEHWRRLVEHVVTDLPVRDNYFLAQIGFGRYLNRRAVPRYLQAENFDRLKEYADRVQIVTDELERFLVDAESDSIEKFAPTNVFEWVDEGTYAQMLRELWRVGSPGARLCYRNLLVRRERPECLAPLLRSHRAEARCLLLHDRSFVYHNFVIEEVVKPAGPPAPGSAATASISSRASRGDRAAWIVERTGLVGPKTAAQTSFIGAKSPRSAR